MTIIVNCLSRGFFPFGSNTFKYRTVWFLTLREKIKTKKILQLPENSGLFMFEIFS